MLTFFKNAKVFKRKDRRLSKKNSGPYLDLKESYFTSQVSLVINNSSKLW